MISNQEINLTSIICLHTDGTSLIYYQRIQTDQETTEETVKITISDQKHHASIYIPGPRLALILLDLNKLTDSVKPILNLS
jgi:hypothetical protein